MTNRTKIIIGIICVVGIAAGKKNKKKSNKEEKQVSNESTLNQYIEPENEVAENSVNEVENVIENVTENTTVENTVQNNTQTTNTAKANQNVVVGKEEQESKKENSEEANKETAIELAKKEWGISVDSYDYQTELQSDGTYIVKVINKTNRTEVTRYNVDVKSGAVTEAE